MKKYTLPLTMMITILTACTQSSLSSTLTPSFTPSLSSLTSTLPSSLSSTSSPSSASLSSELTPSSVTASSTMNTLDAKWVPSLGGLESQNFNQTVLALPSALSLVGVTEVISVTDKTTHTAYAFGFEVNVTGFSGQIRFRVGVRLNAFTGFQVISDSEHFGFGKVILSALTTSLAGVELDYDAVVTMLSSKNAKRAGKSGTYDGIMPAFDRIITFMEGL